MKKGLPEGARIERTVRVGEEEVWLVERHAHIEQMHLRLPDGTIELQFRMQVWDPGREAFITTWLGDLVAAQRLLDRIIENSEYREVE